EAAGRGRPRPGACFPSLGTRGGICSRLPGSLLRWGKAGAFPLSFRPWTPAFERRIFRFSFFYCLVGCLVFFGVSPATQPCPRDRDCFITEWFAPRCRF